MKATPESIMRTNRSIKSNRRNRRTLWSPLPFVVCSIALLMVSWTAGGSLASYGPAGYDPEQQDGIPVLSARSLNPQPADDWLNGDSDGPRRQMGAQRRNSDPDLDDGIEDDDDDEYQSGSNKHEMIEPTFGESKRAAQDGDEIESFFDKHLGPPQEVGSSEDASSEVPIHAAVAGLQAGADPDEEDMFEAAASSPLSTIFQSLLGGGHHRKPLMIHASEETDSGTTTPSGEAASKAAGDPVRSAGSSLRGSSTPAVQHYTQQVAPIAFLTPVASPSTMDAYEEPVAGADEDSQDQQQLAPVREIYIGRRPAVAKYIQQAGYSASNPRATYGQHHNNYQVHQQPQAAWRGQPSSSMMYSQSGRPVAYEQSAPDYSRYPVAASYAYQREQPQQPDDGQTVTYGLSFGASTGVDEVNEEQTGPSNADAAASASDSQDQPPAGGYDEAGHPNGLGYMPAYNARELMRYKTSSTRAHGQYHGGPTRLPAQAYLYQQQYLQQLRQQHQSPYHGSRYHRDPSEAQPVGVVRGQPYSMGGVASAAGQSISRDNKLPMQTREQLLAKLNKEIRASPYYERQEVDVLARRPDRQMSSSQTINKGLLNADLDTYDSYHTEMDPHKTLTTTSKMVRYPSSRLPVGDNIVPVESGSQRISANAEQQPVGLNEQQWPRANNITSTDGPTQTDLLRPDNHSERQNINDNNGLFLTGPITSYDSGSETIGHQQDGGQLAANNNQTPGQVSGHTNLRVRRDDPDDRESDADDDDDGVWVDDDDDDNKQQSSDVNETSQEPEDTEDDPTSTQDQYDANQQAAQVSPPGVIGAPHGYELSPNDLMIYHG